VQAAARAGAVITAENHSTLGGLGSAVAEALCLSGVSVRLAKIGIPDRFVECGSVNYVVEKYAMTSRHIAEAATNLLAGRHA
jgi:transketolase